MARAAGTSCSSTPPGSAPRCSPRWPGHCPTTTTAGVSICGPTADPTARPTGTSTGPDSPPTCMTVIDHLGLVRPDGFGHSCGGASVILAEQAIPGTFGALYCFEPVIFPGTPEDSVMEDNPAFGRGRAADVTRSPRPNWPSSTSRPSRPSTRSIRRHCAATWRAASRSCPPTRAATARRVRLRCRRDDEAAIYAHGFAHHAFDHLARGRVPGHAVLRGRAPTPSVPSSSDGTRHGSPMPASRSSPGVGHFGPLQAPAPVGESVAPLRWSPTATHPRPSLVPCPSTHHARCRPPRSRRSATARWRSASMPSTTFPTIPPWPRSRARWSTGCSSGCSGAIRAGSRSPAAAELELARAWSELPGRPRVRRAGTRSAGGRAAAVGRRPSWCGTTSCWRTPTG